MVYQTEDDEGVAGIVLSGFAATLYPVRLQLHETTFSGSMYERDGRAATRRVRKFAR